MTLPTPVAERVLDLVARIPPGRVMAYGDIAAYFTDLADEAAEAGPDAGLGDPKELRLGPRQVGRVMSHFGGGVPWWRVLRADGTHAPGLEVEGVARLRAEGTPMRAGGTKVDMAKARWDGVERDEPGGDGAGAEDGADVS
ncbi:MGMT family protein [Yinghuangia seranimata]|nr:MGMT family protein [Yinghuangia seranimata]MDI2131023.1 MGMT family protein [Yinghuangia seranimata]